ncbi:hypothetical protein [Streptomyces sp. cmx-18-6]|uniref:hypothetical protein n=1 Tax=Streptomyces sp. cmx-18-6 TaxID=2790930 RepID=UPI00397F8349
MPVAQGERVQVGRRLQEVVRHSSAKLRNRESTRSGRSVLRAQVMPWRSITCAHSKAG